MNIDKSQRAYISSRFMLELDGAETVGTLQSIDGGAFKSDVVEEQVGKEGQATRYPGRPKYDDITVQVGMAMAPRFWNWIKDSFNYDAKRKNGAIIALDYDNHERWRRTFQGALITEVGFPALDGGAKDPAYMTVKFAVERIKEEKPKNEKHKAEQEDQDEWKKQGLWLPSNFTFKMDHFNGDNHLNAKIDAFTVKQSVIECPTGGFLETTKEPGRVEFPKFSITVLQKDAEPWMEWYDQFVRQGLHLPSQEKTGHITYLKRNMKLSEALITLHLHGLGVLGVAPVKHDAKQEQMQQVKVDLYCESIELEPGQGSVPK